MRLSYVIISYNRRDRLLETIALLPEVTPLASTDYEIWVVDNASSDGTAMAVQTRFPRVKVIVNAANQGMFARNHAFSRCAGEYVISLDDDSYPADARGVGMALAHMDANPTTGAMVAKVVLPDGSCEGPALPAVIMGGATCFRKSTLDAVGGFRREFFRQAEEYDLSFRLWHAGWRVDRREDIVIRHEKVAGAGRDDSFVRQMDLRNNLIIAQRFLPNKLRRIYWEDWKLRYHALADGKASNMQIRKAIASAKAWSIREAILRRRLPLGVEALENIFSFRQQADTVGKWARKHSAWRVVLADFGKNIWATYNACRASGLQLRCVADENPAFDGLDYRGLPILPMHKAFEGGSIDGVVIANLNPVQVEARERSIRQVFGGPVLKLWTPPRMATNVRPEIRADVRAHAA
jgi:GT2 family glycosyltransferase